MNYWSCILASLMILGLASSSFADKSFNISVGKMNVGFNVNEGLNINYDGVPVTRDSSMWIHNQAWSYHYYGLPLMKDDIEIKDTPNGKEALLTHKSDAFSGYERISITEKSVSVELKYKLTQDVKDADVEYLFGNIIAGLITGRPYRAITVRGNESDGTVAVRAKVSGVDNNQIGGENVKKLEIDSRIGKLTLDSSSNADGINIFDNRLSPYEGVSMVPVFWAGIGLHLEYGKEYQRTDTLTIDPVSVKNIILTPSSGAVKVEDRSDIKNPVSNPVYVIPEPQSMKFTKSDFVLTPDTQIVLCSGAEATDYRGASTFADEVKILYGYTPKIVTESQADLTKPVILVGEGKRNSALMSAAEKLHIYAPGRAEGYALQVSRNMVLVLGKDKAGSYYGMQTLKQLLKSDPVKVYLQGCNIKDWPSLKFRGAHLFTGNLALPFHTKLMERILARYKMNNIVMEVDFIKWKSDPGIAVDYSMDQEDVKKDIKVADDHFIKITPLLQSMGHLDAIFTNGRNRDIAENPDQPYTYCPLNPRTYPYMTSFYEELEELFNHPKYVHIGHDEVIEPGGYPKHEECKKIGAEKLYVDDILYWHDLLKKYGSRIMMWGDMMLSQGDSPDATNAASPEAAKKMRDQMPRDVVFTDWHYAPDEPARYKSLEIFKKAGHDVIASTWYTPANIENFSKQAKKVGALGLLQTTWAGFNSNENNIRDSFIQFSAMVLAAEYAWNSGKTSLDELPYSWDEEFRKQWNPKPVDRLCKGGFTVDLSALYNTSLADNNAKTGWIGFGPEQDLSALPAGDVRLLGNLYKMPSDMTKMSAIRLASKLDMDKEYPISVNLDINRKASSLFFVHTTLWTGRYNEKVGTYRIHYVDGTSMDCPIVYSSNIVSWIDQRSIENALQIWKGRTKDQQKVSLWRLQWENPKPDIEIKSVEMISENNGTGPVLIALTGLN